MFFLFWYYQIRETNSVDGQTQGSQEGNPGASDPTWQAFCQVWDSKPLLRIIAGVKQGEKEALEISEGLWIFRLGTLEGQGGIICQDERTKM